MQKPEKLPVTFAKNDVEIIARETLYSGFFSMDLYRFRHRLFNGEMSGEIRREIFERGHAAVLLPFDPVRDEVVLVEQIRIAAYDVSESPWLLEMVAGMIEEGETVEDVARREALEEAGLVDDALYLGLGLSAAATLGQVAETVPEWLLLIATLTLLGLTLPTLRRWWGRVVPAAA